MHCSFKWNPHTLQGPNDQELQAQKTAMDTNSGQSRGEEAGRGAAPISFEARAQKEVGPLRSIQPRQSPSLIWLLGHGQSNQSGTWLANNF